MNGILKRAGREASVAANLEELLMNVTLSRSETDCLVWRDARDHNFMVKGAYDNIVKRNAASTSLPHKKIHFSSIWEAMAPFKAKVMAWRLVKNILPTVDNLWKRINAMVDNSACVCCGVVEESARHFFLECVETQKIWHKIVQWCGFNWVAGGLWICVMWILWKWLNDVKLEQKTWDARRIEEETKCRMWSWSICKEEPSTGCSFQAWRCCNLSEVWHEGS